ncbi:S24 family peptidase [Moritella viscosa]|uniref:Prophage MuSo2, transcriptional regulator, Cro/CI family n=1 Tax=Moritella viscosa TaxID=80854 RepID=A0ABY1H8X3_9GAMM|nr:S24 family peptidase [Moritella viscosa]SGY85224.1 Prophage MuSo2, transcriptional regulator, Cro/CI family [Moritella viscosa]
MNGSYPVVDKLPRLAEAAGKSMEWLITGKEVTNTSVNIDEDDAFALIPDYNVQVSAGHGTVCDCDEKPFRHLAFRHKWLKARGFKEGELVVVSTKGDSMEPLISNNDSLVIHTGRTSPRDGCIYVFRNDEELFVKRYQSMLGSWRLISDNQIYSPLDIPKHEQHQFEVIGQVVHIAKDVGN